MFAGIIAPSPCTGSLALAAAAALWFAEIHTIYTKVGYLLLDKSGEHNANGICV